MMNKAGRLFLKLKDILHKAYLQTKQGFSRFLLWMRYLFTKFVCRLFKPAIEGFAALNLRGKLTASGLGCLAIAMVLFAVGMGTRNSGNTVLVSEETEPGYTEEQFYEEKELEEINATPTPSATLAPFSAAISKGDDDELVMNVQARLMQLGYMDDDEPTRHFGSLTEEALRSFQVHNGLVADGVLRDATYIALFSDNAIQYVMQNGDSGDDVNEVQGRLYELGYLAKSYITGKFGDNTQEAVREFQKNNSISADGMVGANTLEMLYAEDVVGNFFKKGDTDSSIKKYQERLIKLGYLSSDYSPKGRLDTKTVDAIKSFQESNNLVADGCLGSSTMAVLDSDNAVAFTLHLGMKGDQVKAVQKRLRELGYLTKNSLVNGYFGEQTEDAVQAFQKRNGLSDDGSVGEKTLARLNSDSAKKAKATATPKATKKATAKPKATSKATAKVTSKIKKATATPKATKKATPTPKPANTNSAKIDNFISIAKTKLGCKYVRGGKGPEIFDCSGFVYWCLKQAGVNQSYMTSIGWRKTSKYTRINSLSEAKKGDVLVFSGSSSDTGHVGICIGSGQMIDASSSAGKIRTTSLSGSYWKAHFICGYHIWG